MLCDGSAQGRVNCARVGAHGPLAVRIRTLASSRTDMAIARASTARVPREMRTYRRDSSLTALPDTLAFVPAAALDDTRHSGAPKPSSISRR